MNLRDGFTLGKWEVYPLEGRIVADGREKRLQPKSADVLLYLAENGGKVAERDELLRQVWGEYAQNDEPLTRCIGELRRAFADTCTQPAYIQTIPKRGYQLIKPVQPIRATSYHGDSSRWPKLPDLHMRPMLTTRTSQVVTAVIVLAIALSGVFVGQTTLRAEGPSTAVSSVRSIAVLPFVNLSSDQEQVYFCDGISEALINLLVKEPALRVVSRTSAFSYRGTHIDIPTMAKQMNVVYVLEGSVRRAEKQLRISARLVDSRSDRQLWSESYERTFDDIFAMQDEIAGRLAERTKMTLLGDENKVKAFSGESYAFVL